MPARAPATASSIRTYAELRRVVETVMLTGQRRIEEAKVRTYWETGRLIGEHLGLHAARADYGAEIVPRLETDLGISQTVLYRATFQLAFAGAHPCAPVGGRHAQGAPLP